MKCRQGDAASHDKFLQLNRAYEVLKDEDLRKKYDKYGEKGLDQGGGGRYESWNYYRYDFGESPIGSPDTVQAILLTCEIILGQASTTTTRRSSRWTPETLVREEALRHGRKLFRGHGGLRGKNPPSPKEMRRRFWRGRRSA